LAGKVGFKGLVSRPAEYGEERFQEGLPQFGVELFEEFVVGEVVGGDREADAVGAAEERGKE